jgi:hypothetical protein
MRVSCKLDQRIEYSLSTLWNAVDVRCRGCLGRYGASYEGDALGSRGGGNTCSTITIRSDRRRFAMPLAFDVAATSAKRSIFPWRSGAEGRPVPQMPAIASTPGCSGHHTRRLRFDLPGSGRSSVQSVTQKERCGSCSTAMHKHLTRIRQQSRVGAHPCSCSASVARSERKVVEKEWYFWTVAGPSSASSRPA